MWVQLAGVALRAGEHVAAKRYLVEALRHSRAYDDGETEWELSLVQAWLVFLEGEPKQAVQTLLRVQAGAKSGSSALWGETVTAVVRFLVDAGRNDDAKLVIDQSLPGMGRECRDCSGAHEESQRVYSASL